MISKELRERETSQVEHELKDRYKHLFELRAQAVTEKLEDPSQLRKTRKEIARLKTLLNERKRAAASNAEATKTGEGTKAEGTTEAAKA
jgi:large subunit ribosomal protein L29